MSSYNVHSIFYTLQGEGMRAGTPAVFVRFSGCNLWSGLPEHRTRDAKRSAAECALWCDTAFARGTHYELVALVDAIRREAQGGWVVLTGGEPALQADPALLYALQDAGYKIAMETNGTVPVDRAALHWLTVSPKCLGEKWLQRLGNELKVVVPAMHPLTVAGLCERRAFDHFLVVPQDGPQLAENTRAAVEFVKSNPRWRVGIQAHKHWDIP